MKTKPNERNACSGRFCDWLEVNLTSACNGSCSWCVEKRGWKPGLIAGWMQIADAAIGTDAKNIILLGGEPTLHPDIGRIILRIGAREKNVYVTTNGSKLSKQWVEENMKMVSGVNISIHHFDLNRNAAITGIRLNSDTLSQAIERLRFHGATTRLNCNCIEGEIDSVEKMRAYITFARVVGAEKVRFAELKFDDDNFVDLAEILDHKYGLNDNPFEDGCNSDAVIDGMPVNFRQMCGFQTRARPSPDDPDFEELPPVLYFDGKLYAGWQTEETGGVLWRGDGKYSEQRNELESLLNSVRYGNASVADVVDKIQGVLKRAEAKVKEPEGGGYCQY